MSKKVKKVHGPYTRKDGRKHVVTVFDDGTKKTTSYPKWLKEQELGRELDPFEETIDHRDRNFKNDHPDNIQILTRSENAAKSALRRKKTFLPCVNCGKPTEMTHDRITSNKRGKTGPFCSRRCSGQYGSSVRANSENKIAPMPFTVEYYRKDDKE